MRMTCGGDRIRIWRITDPDTLLREKQQLMDEIHEIRLKSQIDATQLISDHNHKEGMLEATKLELERQISKLKQKKEIYKSDSAQTGQKVTQLEQELKEARQSQADYQ